MRKFKLYSKRKTAPKGPLRHDIPSEFKYRIINHFDDFCDASLMNRMVRDLGNILNKEYGYLNTPSYAAIREYKNDVFQHFMSSGVDQSLDFIEAIFHCPDYTAEQAGVDIINDLFCEHGLGYRLSNYVCKEIKTKLSAISKTYAIEYPAITAITSAEVYETSVKPALHLLASPDYAVCNSELLDAFTAMRTHHYDEAITNSGSAMESFMKTICTKKGVLFDPQRDTTSKLVSALVDKGVLPDAYRTHFDSIGTIRNRLSSAHGRGPVPAAQPEMQHAEHHINAVCACMVLLHALANP